MDDERTYTAFEGDSLLASGGLRAMLLRVKERLDLGNAARILIFEDQTGKQIDFDFRGTPDEVLERLKSHPHFGKASGIGLSGPGRPKLGVVSREVSLLPRHWEWLEQQPGGISAAIRRLVDETRKSRPERARAAREALSRFMTAMAGDFAGFEEASRALFAMDWPRFRKLTGPWPADIRAHLERMAQACERSGAD